MTTKRFYETPAAETRTLTRAETYRKLYPTRSGRPTSDLPFNSAYGPRINHAVQRNNYTEAARLKTERAELEKLADELQLDDRQTLRVANALRDTNQKPLSANLVNPRDSYRLRERFGTRVGMDYIDVDAASIPALDHLFSKLGDKPVLKEAFDRGNARFHADVAETAIEVAIADGIVKPVPITQ